MRSLPNYAATVFFSILGIFATTIFSSIIISQNRQIKLIQSMQNNNQNNKR